MLYTEALRQMLAERRGSETLTRVMTAGHEGHAGLAGDVRLRLRDLPGDEGIGSCGDRGLEVRLRATRAPGYATQGAAVTRHHGRHSTERQFNLPGECRQGDRLQQRANEAEVLLAKACVCKPSQALPELRVVAELWMRIERQVVGKQVDVVREQRRQALLEPPGHRPLVPTPEQPVVNQNRIGPSIDRRVDQRPACSDPAHESLHLGSTLDLKTVRPIILEARRLQQSRQIRSDFDAPSHRPTVMRKTWLIFSQAVTVALAILFVVATLKPDWLQRKPGQAWTGISAPADFLPAPATAASGVVTSYAAAAKRASPAVVSITASRANARSPHDGDPWFQFFFGGRENRVEPQVGLGSGVIVSPQGFLLTNNHVIEGASDIDVQLTDGRSAPATVVGTDPESDVAVLKIELDRLPVIAFGNTDGLQVGDVVLAIGNPFGVGQTVTSGIVSALGRDRLGINTFENFIQTDAAINPGNSGGALIDAAGNLVGINTAIYSRSGGNMGIGFAIPGNTAKQVMESLIRDGQVTRGWIGVEPRDLTPEIAESLGLAVTQGVLITGVLQNGPAGEGGLRPGDVVTEVTGKPVLNTSQLLNAVAALKPESVAAIGVQRGKQSLLLNVTVAQRPTSVAPSPQRR